VSSGSQGGGAEWIKANGAPAKGKSWDQAVSKEWITEYQVRKAAWVLSRFAQFRQMVAE
jgi:carnitine O-acetyltransferase